jgi:1,4-dihydroxy-2-naphthoyl-CoA synthase
MTTVLQYEQDDLGVVTLTLNHPETRNALTGTGIVEAMLDACHRIEHDPSVRAVSLRPGIFLGRQDRRNAEADWVGLWQRRAAAGVPARHPALAVSDSPD